MKLTKKDWDEIWSWFPEPVDIRKYKKGFEKTVNNVLKRKSKGRRK